MMTLEPMTERRRTCTRTPVRPRTRVNWGNVQSALVLTGMAAVMLLVLVLLP